MKYVTYESLDNILYIFIARGMQQGDEDAMEFHNVQLLGMFDPKKPQHNGFDGKEEFFVFYPEDKPEIDMSDFNIYNEMSPFFQGVMGKIAEGILPQNYQSSLKALFGELNPYGNN